MGAITSRNPEKEELKAQISAFNDQLQRALIGCGQARLTFITLSDLWDGSRQEAMTTLSTVADEIDRHHFNVNIANMTGTSSNIAGGTAAIASIALAPFSGGLSTALAAGSLFGIVAGSATSLGANIVEVMLTKELMDQAKHVLETDAMYTKALSAAFKELIIHENELLCLLAELQADDLNKELESALQKTVYTTYLNELKLKLKQFSNGPRPIDDILSLLSCLYAEDDEFLKELKKTDELFKDTPSVSTTLSTSTEFFQALKEFSVVGPETLKNISNAAIQGSAAAGAAEVATLGSQLVTAGFGAVFIALDAYNLIRTTKNYDEGSKTELGRKIREVVLDLHKEQQQVRRLCDIYKNEEGYLADS